jgi:hypothetical protein
VREIGMSKSLKVAVSYLLCGLSAIAAQAEGLRQAGATRDAPLWPQWQARRTVLAATAPPLSLWTAEQRGPDDSVAPSQVMLLVGDYFFSRPGLSWWPKNGALRASTGLVVTHRSGAGLRQPFEAPGATASASLPYVGLGYSGLSAKGSWSFTADLGMIAENPSGAGRAGRALFGSQGLEAALRELRLTPLLQLSVRYEF